MPEKKWEARINRGYPVGPADQPLATEKTLPDLLGAVWAALDPELLIEMETDDNVCIEISFKEA